MWGTIILIFVAVWMLQIALTYIQARHFNQTVREMSNEHSGYLGVGVAKQKLGVGSVTILVSDLNGKIIKAKEMTGVTVLSRFKPVAELVGHSIHTFEYLVEPNNRCKAILMAVQKIKEQVPKEL